MKISEWIMVMACLAPAALHVPAAGASPVPVLRMIAGDVRIIAKGVPRAAAVDEPLGGSDVIITGAKSLADISFGDRGLVRVQENTRLSIASLAGPGGSASLDLDSGGILVVLSKLVRGESFQVKTHTQVASVRGTSFQVSGDNASSRVDVLTGTVTIHPVENEVIRREIAEHVPEGHSTFMDRAAVRNIMAGRRTIAMAQLRGRDLDRLIERFGSMRDSRGFGMLNGRIRNEISDRLRRDRHRLNDGRRTKLREWRRRERFRQRRTTGR